MKTKINSLLELINQSDTKDISGEEAIALINKIKTMSTSIKEGEEVQELKQIQEEKLVEKIETTETEVQTDMLAEKDAFIQTKIENKEFTETGSQVDPSAYLKNLPRSLDIKQLVFLIENGVIQVRENNIMSPKDIKELLVRRYGDIEKVLFQIADAYDYGVTLNNLNDYKSSAIRHKENILLSIEDCIKEKFDFYHQLKASLPEKLSFIDEEIQTDLIGFVSEDFVS